jgi:hypothetical protein
VDVDVKILVEFDDTLVCAGLFLDGTLADVITVGQLNLVLLLVLLPILAETVYHLGLCNHLIGKGL